MPKVPKELTDKEVKALKPKLGPNLEKNNGSSRLSVVFLTFTSAGRTIQSPGFSTTPTKASANQWAWVRQDL